MSDLGLEILFDISKSMADMVCGLVILLGVVSRIIPYEWSLHAFF